jgi:hypothetical protein
MIGRGEQIKTFQLLLGSEKSEFVAVTGRRRVGKTYLIDTVCEKNICFRMTGIQDANLKEQLRNFATKLVEYSKVMLFDAPKDWQAALQLLKIYLQTLPKTKKQVIFIDELPWVNTPKSGFLKMLAHLWNDYLSKESHFVLVICGSATSWITKQVINNKGGFHNRISANVRLQPFSIDETKAFLESKKINFTDQELVRVFLTMGGIPYYLENIRKGESATQAIERMCFTETGILKNEYSNLYKALFTNAEHHEEIVKTLAISHGGLTREEIIKKSNILAGGPYDRTMEDLILTGFVVEDNHFGNKKRGAIYRLQDEYSVFYHRFIKENSKNFDGQWSQLSATPTYKIWSGYAFENLCHKHIDKLKSVLGIAAVYTETSRLNAKATESEDGFQIDLIIDRNDNTINLCEIKYYAIPFKIDKKYYEELLMKKENFKSFTKTKKQVFLTLISNFGLLENEYSREIIDSTISLEDIIQ